MKNQSVETSDPAMAVVGERWVHEALKCEVLSPPRYHRRTYHTVTRAANTSPTAVTAARVATLLRPYAGTFSTSRSLSAVYLFVETAVTVNTYVNSSSRFGTGTKCL